MTAAKYAALKNTTKSVTRHWWGGKLWHQYLQSRPKHPRISIDIIVNWFSTNQLIYLHINSLLTKHKVIIQPLLWKWLEYATFGMKPRDVTTYTNRNRSMIPKLIISIRVRRAKTFLMKPEKKHFTIMHLKLLRLGISLMFEFKPSRTDFSLNSPKSPLSDLVSSEIVTVVVGGCDTGLYTAPGGGCGGYWPWLG